MKLFELVNPKNSPRLAERARSISPFYVMDILAEAKRLQANGHDIIHLEVGEPDFTTAQPIIDAGIQALKEGKTHYTPALGLPELRTAIASWYQSYYAVRINPQRIVVTPGASGALLLLLGAVVEKGQNILLTDPGYPCNRNFARFIEAKVKTIPVSEQTHFQAAAADIENYWDEQTALALFASPSNPTGSILSRDSLLSLSKAVQAKQGLWAVDEIYHGLNYDGIQAETVLSVDDNAFGLNSFSKYFGMTGWRLGWLVVPEAYTDAMDRLAQNLFLAPPTMAQYAALAAFSEQTLDILQQRRDMFEQRRNVLIDALTGLDFKITMVPQGAFYVYADCRHLLSDEHPDSMALCRYWLKEAGVAVTPGNDFGLNQSQYHVRFAYTTEQSRLIEAIDRIATLHATTN